MVQSIRRHVPSLVVVVAVVALAASQVTAQPGGNPGTGRFSPAAAVDADKVDGKHAVGAGASAQERANKLVATNDEGLLPTDIVLPGWKSDVIYSGQLAAYPGQNMVVFDINDLPANADYLFSLIPSLPPSMSWGIQGATVSFQSFTQVRRTIDGDVDFLGFVARNASPFPVGFKVRVIAFSKGIAPAGLMNEVQSARVHIVNTKAKAVRR